MNENGSFLGKEFNGKIWMKDLGWILHYYLEFVGSLCPWICIR